MIKTQSTLNLLILNYECVARLFNLLIFFLKSISYDLNYKILESKVSYLFFQRVMEIISSFSYNISTKQSSAKKPFWLFPTKLPLSACCEHHFLVFHPIVLEMFMAFEVSPSTNWDIHPWNLQHPYPKLGSFAANGWTKLLVSSRKLLKKFWKDSLEVFNNEFIDYCRE